ncbi:MAG: hypothetical protein GEU77_08575 [Deltaproteobacteria bacterium]|nr:hypothetical protein [Deltaproteobacteria bacterium]
MPRKFLALLLILSWICLSGIDVLEDLDLAGPVELYNSAENPFVTHGQTGRPTHNIVESAGHSRFRCSSFLARAAALLLPCSPTLSQKTYKLHKLHHVFLL